MIEHFGIKDIIDIVLVALVMYNLYFLVERSGSRPIFKGVVAFMVLWILVSQVFQMKLMGAILDKIVNVGLLVLVIIFQDEIRRFLTSFGSNRAFLFVTNFLRTAKEKSDIEDSLAMSLILASMNMAKTYTGALIVIEQEVSLASYEESGERINGDLSTRLIENIFFKNSPLHDGAVIVSGSKIKSAGCILPISQSQDLPKSMGLRHRAALGITHSTDAKVIVVSEERGKISYASRGEIHVDVTPEELKKLLSSRFEDVPEEDY